MTEDEIVAGHPEAAEAEVVAAEHGADGQFDQRIRAALASRAGSVRVESDLVGLAKQSDQRRSVAQRFPLVAVAVVIAALAVTTAVLRPASDRDSHVISRSGNQRDRTEDPSSSTSGATSTSGPGRSSTTTTTAVPTTVQPPEGTTSSTVPGGAPDDGTGTAPEPDPGDGPPCPSVEGDLLASTTWEGDFLYVVEIGRNQTLRHLTIWRDPRRLDACQERLQDPSGQPFLFHQATTGDPLLEIHTFGCSPPRFEVADGFTEDGVTWNFRLQTYVLDGFVATVVDDREAQYVEPADHAAIEALRQLNCGVLDNRG